jgi:hypothetical protein
MKIARLAGLMLVAVMALSLTVASAAFAEAEFKPVGGTFKGTSSTTNKLVAGTNTITCKANTSSGTISNAFLAGGVTVSFTGCTSKKGAEGAACTAKSVGAAEGSIVTNTLHGVLGLIVPKGTGTGVALDLLPLEAAEGVFVDIAKNSCTVETAVEGSVAGEVSPVGKSQTTGALLFDPSGTTQTIKEITLSSNGAAVKPGLKAFGATATQETTEALTFSANLEVT